MNDDWRSAAACREAKDPDIFFPPAGDTPQRKKAVAICAGCPVREPCLDFAIATHQEGGIWGGLDLRERDAVQRLRRRGAAT